MITVYFFSQAKHLEISFLPCLQIISGPWKVTPGFSVVENELGKVNGQSLSWISHNRATFSGYYTDITNDLLLLQTNMKDLSPREWIIVRNYLVPVQNVNGWMNSIGRREKKEQKDDTCYLKRQH